MPIPKKRADESRKDFVKRCMDDDVMKKEYPESGQRLAVCNLEANKLLKK